MTNGVNVDVNEPDFAEYVGEMVMGDPFSEQYEVNIDAAVNISRVAEHLANAMLVAISRPSL